MLNNQVLCEDISIHVPRVGDDYGKPTEYLKRRISIHVPRVGDDLFVRKKIEIFNISIHVPRVGDDRKTNFRLSVISNFNPRPPCGGRPLILSLSIRAA